MKRIVFIAVALVVFTIPTVVEIAKAPYESYLDWLSCRNGIEELSREFGDRYGLLVEKYCGLPFVESHPLNIWARYDYRVYFKNNESKKKFLNETAISGKFDDIDDKNWPLEEVEGVVAIIKMQRLTNVPLEIAEFNGLFWKRLVVWRNPKHRQGEAI